MSIPPSSTANSRYVANTDFSFSARHNLEFVNKNGVIFPIIFDYDQAGVINTVYAVPDPSLGIQRVTYPPQRRQSGPRIGAATPPCAFGRFAGTTFTAQAPSGSGMAK